MKASKKGSKILIKFKEETKPGNHSVADYREAKILLEKAYNALKWKVILEKQAFQFFEKV